MKRYICFFAAILLAIAPVAYLGSGDFSSDIALTLDIPVGEDSKKISSWRSNSGDYYIFLPAYADMNTATLSDVQNTSDKVYIDSAQAKEGMSLGDFEPDRAYSLSYRSWGRNIESTLTFVKAGTLPTLHIDTQSGNMDYVHEKKGNEESADIAIYSPEGNRLLEDSGAQINGRGNSTWEQHEKKPYSLKLSREAEIPGIGKGQKWILLANASDPTHMRNKLAYDIAAAIGLRYSPESCWVNVFLNGKYAGLYQLSERNEIHTERINIDSDSGVLVSMENISRMDKQSYQYITTAENQALRIHYPEIPSAEKTAYIASVIQKAEDAILNNSNDLFSLIDMESWVKKYLADEVFGNVDGGYISQYFYYDSSENSKIHAGPVWDYDFAMGSDAVWQTGFTDAFFANRLIVREGVNTPWFHHLYNNERFFSEVLRIYRETFAPCLEKKLGAEFDIYKNNIRCEAENDGIRWADGKYDFDASTEKLRDYMTRRMTFLNDIWYGDTVYHTVCFNDDVDTNYAYTMVADGGRVSHLPKTYEIEGRTFAGWYRADTDELFNPEDAVYEDINLYAKWDKEPVSGLGGIVKLAPLGMIALFGVILLIADIKRNTGSR